MGMKHFLRFINPTARFAGPPPPPLPQVPACGVPELAVLRPSPELHGARVGADGVERGPRGCVHPPVFLDGLFLLLLFLVFGSSGVSAGRPDVGCDVGGAADLPGRADGAGERDRHEGEGPRRQRRRRRRRGD